MYRALGWSWFLETESQSSKFHAIRFIHIVDGFTYSFRWFLWINVSVVTSPMDPYMHFFPVLSCQKNLGFRMFQEEIWCKTLKIKWRIATSWCIHRNSKFGDASPFPLGNDEIRWTMLNFTGLSSFSVITYHNLIWFVLKSPWWNDLDCGFCAIFLRKQTSKITSQKRRERTRLNMRSEPASPNYEVQKREVSSFGETLSETSKITFLWVEHCWMQY